MPFFGDVTPVRKERRNRRETRRECDKIDPGHRRARKAPWPPNALAPELINVPSNTCRI